MNFYIIGTIVKLKNEQKVMITGYYPIIIEEKQIFDYLGCMYPEGVLDSKQNIFFDKNDISEVLWNRTINDRNEKIIIKLNLFEKSNQKEMIQKKLI